MRVRGRELKGKVHFDRDRSGGHCDMLRNSSGLTAFESVLRLWNDRAKVNRKALGKRAVLHDPLGSAEVLLRERDRVAVSGANRFADTSSYFAIIT